MLTLLYGTDGYRLHEASLLARASAEQVFDGTSADALSALGDAFKYPSLLGGPRALMVTDAANDEVLEALKSHDASARDDLALTAIQVIGAKPVAAVNAALKRLVAMATDVRRYEPLAGHELHEWVRGFCRARGAAITDDALHMLISRAGNSWMLASELEKLSAYCGTEPIGTEAVDALTRPPDSYDQWALSNAVQSGDKRNALAQLWTSLARGVPEPLLAGTLASSVRTLLAVRDLASRGVATGAIASQTGLHPFVVSKSLRSARVADRTKLAAAHAALATLDRNAKSGVADYADGLYQVLFSL
jgi:DNA polymerase III delta subunit